MLYISFSLMMVTQSNNIVELLTITWLGRMSQVYHAYQVNSSIFNTTDAPIGVCGLQWITRNFTNSSGSIGSGGFYYVQVYLSTTYSLNIHSNTTLPIDTTGYKLTVLLVANSTPTTHYSNIAYKSSSRWPFQPNLGVDTAIYG